MFAGLVQPCEGVTQLPETPKTPGNMGEELWGGQGWQGQQQNHPHITAALCCNRALEAFEA